MRKVTLKVDGINYVKRLEEILKEIYNRMEEEIEVEIDDSIDLERLVPFKSDWDYESWLKMNEVIDNHLINVENWSIFCGLEYNYQIKSVEEVEVVK